jgi:hypothetical protein
MKRILLFGALAFSLIQSTYGFDDVTKFQERIKILDSYKNSETVKIQSDVDKKIKGIESYQHPNLLSYDKKIKAETLKIINDHVNAIHLESESISFFHIEKEIKKLTELKQQRQNYLDAETKKEELKNNSSNSKNLKKYMTLMESTTNTIQDAMIEGRYLLLTKEEKKIADEFKENIFHIQRENGIQKSLDKSIKEQSGKIEEALKFEEEKISLINVSQNSINKEFEKFSDHIQSLDQKQQFSWNISSYLTQDQMGGFSCDPKINAKYYRFKNYPNLIAFNNGKDYKTIISLDKENPKNFNQVYTCTQGAYGCFDKKEPALCGLDPECRNLLENAVNSFRIDGYKEFKYDLLSEAVAKNKSDQFKDGNLINELLNEKRLSESDIKKLKELHDSIGIELKSLKNNNPEEFHKEVKKKIDGLVDTEKSNPKFSKNMQLAYIFMLQGFKSKVGELKGDYFLEMNSFKFCPGQTESTKIYCDNFSAYQKSVKKFDEVEEIENLTPNECPMINIRIPKNELPSQDECKIKPIVNDMEDMIKIHDELKKSLK